MLSDLIAKAIDLKAGNREFALFYDPAAQPCEWEAHIGNPTSCVRLGEVCGDLWAKGGTAEQAVENLIAQLTPATS